MVGTRFYTTQRLHTVGQRLLLHFGLHCATHQIRIILVSCVVITSLFYPALAIYASSQHKSLSILSTFTSPTATPGLDVPVDLINLWSCHHALRVHQDAVTRAKCGAGRALRVERLLIRGPAEHGAINHRTLRTTLTLENRLEQGILEGSLPCLKRADGKCFVLSPLLFWGHNAESLHADRNLLDTINASKNVSLGGLVVTPQMVLARRGSYEPQVAGSRFGFAEFLALTYFFPDSECLGTSEHTSWLHLVQNALIHELEATVETQEPTIISLEYDLNASKAEGWSALSAFLHLAYAGFLVYVIWSVGNMTAVHSRLGVTFTALVEIACSTITSLSVCALVGFKITMVPWEILPIVIMFVGAENMFNLVDAVCKTPVTLSVKQRIAEGLSRAGTSNTMKVVTYNIILGIIAVFSFGAVRQFCSFAIVVLVAHWFLAHTFFLAVLSIDMQRLELDELLRRDPSILLSHRPPRLNEPSKKPGSSWQKTIFTAQNILKGRATTNLSLLMLLAIAAALYYTTYTTSTFEGRTAHLKHFMPSVTSSQSLFHQTKPMSWHIWKTLNPSQAPLLYLRVEAPNVLAFHSEKLEQVPNGINTHSGLRLSMGRFRHLLWLVKIMVFPIALTTTLLWVLLLYLLKDTELVEIQRNRAEPDFHDSKEDFKIVHGHISFSTLPPVFPSDIELVAASDDGNVIVSVGLHNEVAVWRVKEQTHIHLDTADMFHRVANTSPTILTITCLAVDAAGCHFAAGTSTGKIGIWTLGTDIADGLPFLCVDNVFALVTEIQFTSAASLVPWQPSSPSKAEAWLLATYDGGLAAKWSLAGGLPSFYMPSHRASVVKCSLHRLESSPRVFIAFMMSDGTLELADTGESDPCIKSELCIQAGDPFSIPSKVNICQANLGGLTRYIIAVATETGIVSLWDGITGECISILDDVYNHIGHLQVTQVKCETCRFCGQLPLECWAVAFSVAHTVHFFKLYLNDQTRRCSCSRRPLSHIPSRDIFGRRSRSNSTSQSISIPVSPSIPRARLATTLESTPFPVSGHGVHSRRVNEKELGRKASEILAVFSSGEELGQKVQVHPTSVSSVWHDAVLVRVTDIACERGGWGFHEKNLVGIRRKPRTRGVQSGTGRLQGLSQGTLERWEMWTFDPSASCFRSSFLASLIESIPPPADCVIPHLPFTQVTPLLFTPAHAFAGFGNTIGVFSFT